MCIYMYICIKRFNDQTRNMQRSNAQCQRSTAQCQSGFDTPKNNKEGVRVGVIEFEGFETTARSQMQAMSFRREHS